MSKTNSGQQAAALLKAAKENRNTKATTYTEDTTTPTVKRNYRVNLAFDSDLKEFINNASWEKHQSITQWLNDLVRAEMEKAAADPEGKEG